MRRNVSRVAVVRKERNQRWAIKTWVNRLSGYPAFVLGNGPSINDHDVKSIENYFQIGINRSFYLLDTTILMWQDISLWNTEYHKLHNTQALKVVRDVADPRRIYYNFHLKSGAYLFDRSKTHILYGCGSTGPLAVQLAVAMGCSPIVLLGMDCKPDKNGNSDFYGNNSFHSSHTMDYCKIGLQFIKDRCPTKIISCSNSTEFWPREELDDVLKKIGKEYAIGRQSYVNKIING